MQGGRSGELVRRLMLTFESQGARVLDATGTATADKQRFLSALEAERSRSHATSAFDVMVGIQRVLEGTDWPVCCLLCGDAGFAKSKSQGQGVPLFFRITLASWQGIIVSLTQPRSLSASHDD